jgi:hypothetical protein
MRLLAISLLAILLPLAAPNAQSAPALWGRLERGEHAIGVRQLLLRDRSRPALADEDGARAGDSRGRQIQVIVWYPARAPNGRPMRYGDYVELAAQALEFAPLTAARRQQAINRYVEQSGTLGGDSAALRAAWPKIAATPMAAFASVAPARGRFPLVLFPDWRAPSHISVLAEYLASHGYVVASNTISGTYDAQVEVSTRGLETQAADLRFVLAALDTMSFVDTSRIAGIGLGIAASGVLALQMRTPAIRAFASLEGGVTTASEIALLAASPFYDVAAVRVPILAITAPHASVDANRLDRYRYATRHLVHFPKMGEFWFQNWGMLEQQVPRVIGAPPGDTRTGFEWGARWVRRFLDAYLQPDAAARAARDSAGASRAEREGVFTVITRPGLAPPPTVAELKQAIVARGIPAVAELVQSRIALDSQPIPADYFTALASWLATTNRDARGDQRHDLAALRVRLFPRSSRAHYSLAMTAVQRADTARARVELNETLRLVVQDDDPTLDASTRARIERQARETLDRLRTQ